VQIVHTSPGVAEPKTPTVFTFPDTTTLAASALLPRAVLDLLSADDAARARVTRAQRSHRTACYHVANLVGPDRVFVTREGRGENKDKEVVVFPKRERAAR
jgi:hypothetical protein